MRSKLFENNVGPGLVAHACNPSTLEAKVNGSPSQHGKILSLLKIQKLAGGGSWCAHVVPATQEAKTGKSIT